MSLRLRLALWYGTLTGVVVALVGLFSYAEHARVHYEALDRALVGAAEHLAGVHAAEVTSHELARMLAVPLAPDVSVRVYDAAGQVLAASPGDAAPALDPRAVVAHPAPAAFDFLAGLAPPLEAAAGGSGSFGLLEVGSAARWRAYALPLEHGQGYLVAIAPLDALDTSVALFRRYMLLLTLLGLGLSLGAAYLVAGRALQPVSTLTEAAGAIARSRGFSRRVPLGGRRDELGRLAATFNEMLASLEQAYRSQERFVSDASHELRAPLTVIQGNLELLERQPDMPAEARREAIAEASREAHRLARLVGELLALARADAGFTLRRRRVELDRVLLEVLGEARHLARGQRLELGALQPLAVQGDPDSLKQLLLILVDNALKYTPPGGSVSLALLRHGASAEVLVTDTGVGILPEALPRVFDRFYRADPARGRDPGGSGLGLPIARWIVEQHGGTIALESEPGRGTTVRVRLPAGT